MLASARSHRLALGLAATGAALALAACGADDPESTAGTEEVAEDTEEEEEVEEADADADADTSDFNVAEVPAEAPELDESELPEEPGTDAPLGDRIAWDALEDVSTFASTTDPDATYECPEIAGDEGETATCTVTFLDEEFEYSIDIESGGMMINYEVDFPEGPLVQEIVEDSLRADTGSEAVLCDMEAEVMRGETDSDAPFECQSLDEESGEVSDHTLSISMYGAFSFYPA